MQISSTRLLPFCTISLLILSSTGCQQAQRVRDYFSGNTPGKYARLMEDTNFPDNRRIAINTLAKQDFGQRPPYTTRYRQIFQSDEDPLVRATALRALNFSRDKEAADLYLKALADGDGRVRLEGAKALNNMPDPAATDALLKLLNAPEEDQDTRIAAAAALQHYPRRDVARSLAAVLGERNFGIAWQARRSLRKITGADYAYDNTAWLEYISNPAQPLG